MTNTKATRTYTDLTALDSTQRCSYLLPNRVQCFRNGVTKVIDRVTTNVYYLCKQHSDIMKAVDAGQMTLTGDPTIDQRLPASVNDDGGYDEASKDQTNRKRTGAFNTAEVQPSS